MTTQTSRPSCYGGEDGRQCVRLHVGDADELMPDRLTCDAFPDGIPDAILKSGYDHRKRYRGDQGITYEPIRLPYSD